MPAKPPKLKSAWHNASPVKQGSGGSKRNDATKLSPGARETTIGLPSGISGTVTLSPSNENAATPFSGPGALKSYEIDRSKLSVTARAGLVYTATRTLKATPTVLIPRKVMMSPPKAVRPASNNRVCIDIKSQIYKLGNLKIAETGSIADLIAKKCLSELKYYRRLCCWDALHFRNGS